MEDIGVPFPEVDNPMTYILRDTKTNKWGSIVTFDKTKSELAIEEITWFDYPEEGSYYDLATATLIKDMLVEAKAFSEGDIEIIDTAKLKGEMSE